MEGTACQGIGYHPHGTCQHVIHEADYMAAVMAVGMREPVKTPTLGALASKFSKENSVQQSKDQFLLDQRLNCADGMADATAQFHRLLRGSSYHEEVIAEVRTLTEEMKKTSEAPAPCIIPQAL